MPRCHSLSYVQDTYTQLALNGRDLTAMSSVYWHHDVPTELESVSGLLLHRVLDGEGPMKHQSDVWASELLITNLISLAPLSAGLPTSPQGQALRLSAEVLQEFCRIMLTRGPSPSPP